MGVVGNFRARLFQLLTPSSPQSWIRPFNACWTVIMLVYSSTYYASIILKIMLMFAYYAQNYASIICKALGGERVGVLRLDMV